MYLTIVTALTDHVARHRVVGELVAVRIALGLLMDLRFVGENRDAVDVVVIQLIAVAGHQIVVVVELFDVRLFLRRAVRDHVIDRGVVLGRVDLHDLTGQLHAALRNQHIARKSAHGVGLVVGIHAVGVHDVDRLITVILLCQCRLKEQQPRYQQAELQCLSGVDT